MAEFTEEMYAAIQAELEKEADGLTPGYDLLSTIEVDFPTEKLRGGFYIFLNSEVTSTPFLDDAWGATRICREVTEFITAGVVKVEWLFDEDDNDVTEEWKFNPQKALYKAEHTHFEQ